MTTSKSDSKSDSKASADTDEAVYAPPVAPLAEPATEAPSVITDPSESSDGPGPPSDDVGGPQTVAIPKSRMVQEAGAFLGVSAATAAGALADMDDDHELTVDEARKALASFGVEL